MNYATRATASHDGCGIAIRGRWKVVLMKDHLCPFVAYDQAHLVDFKRRDEYRRGGGSSSSELFDHVGATTARTRPRQTGCSAWNPMRLGCRAGSDPPSPLVKRPLVGYQEIEGRVSTVPPIGSSLMLGVVTATGQGQIGSSAWCEVGE